MKVNSENAKLQCAIGRRLKAGMPVVGLLAGLLTTTVAAEEKGSESPLAGKPLPPKVEQRSHVRGRIEMEMPPLMGKAPVPQTQDAETNNLALVSDRKASDGKTPLFIHNIGEGTKEEDGLFAFQLTGHHRLR